MRCPRCLENFHEQWVQVDLQAPDTATEKRWHAERTICPACNQATIRLRFVREGEQPWTVVQVWPKGAARPPLSPHVLEEFASDYREASVVLDDSPKASAALSRRCLQNLLRDVAGVAPGDLFDEIGQVMPKLPSYLASAVDAVRTIGNLAAHPTKSKNTGAIVDVEPGEAEWLLEVLEGLFDFYFVQPALLADKRAALSQKLVDAGRPPLCHFSRI